MFTCLSKAGDQEERERGTEAEAEAPVTASSTSSSGSRSHSQSQSRSQDHDLDLLIPHHINFQRATPVYNIKYLLRLDMSHNGEAIVL